jgi:hypothetical protein
MTTSAPTSPTLTGVFSETGECDRCGRELGRVFQVRLPDGSIETYGRKCAAHVTGWTVTDAKLRQAQRMEERRVTLEARKAELRAHDPEADESDSYGAFWQVLVSDQLWREGAKYTWRDQYDAWA